MDCALGIKGELAKMKFLLIAWQNRGDDRHLLVPNGRFAIDVA